MYNNNKHKIVIVYLGIPGRVSSVSLLPGLPLFLFRSSADAAAGDVWPDSDSCSSSASTTDLAFALFPVRCNFK